jgi:hypothetical protein
MLRLKPPHSVCTSRWALLTMEKAYIKFKINESADKPKSNNRLWLAVKNILALIIPKANPDFDDKIENVREWMLEFDSDSELPEREIGIDEYGNVILKLPWKNNYGYWSDNNLKIEDFIKLFTPISISMEEFEDNWLSL